MVLECLKQIIYGTYIKEEKIKQLGACQCNKLYMMAVAYKLNYTFAYNVAVNTEFYKV
jgi:hypothetical protein